VLQRIFLALVMGLAWMPLTANISIESYGVGVLLSFAVLTLLFSAERPATDQPGNIPDRIIASVVYFVTLCRDIFLSSVEVARRVTRRDMGLNPGIIAVPTQHTAANADLVAAISAHGITITPGELAVDFDGNQMIYVHCLDVVASAKVAESNQAKRIALLKRILK
jgi:multicomponent Na+:H+ antiporter subunit E